MEIKRVCSWRSVLCDLEWIVELEMLRDPVWAGMSLEGLCYVRSSAADFLGDLTPAIRAPGASDPF